MKLKLNADGSAVVQDGKPVYIKDDGTEVAFDAPGTLATISRLNGESKTNREAREAAETRLAAFKDIADPAAALKAMALAQNLDDKKLIDAGDVERLKSEITKGYETKLSVTAKERDDAIAAHRHAVIGMAFDQSAFIKEKVAIPAAFMREAFLKNFAMKEGKIVAVDSQGQPIFSNANPGEVAGFEEAIASMVNSHADKASILKGNTNGGGGARTAQTTGGGAKVMTRAEFDAVKQPGEKSRLMSEGLTLTD